MIDSNPHAEASAAITSIRLIRVTETNSTLVEWACDYSSDATNKFVLFNQNAFLQNLNEMRAHFQK
jgi:hypothetical protein